MIASLEAPGRAGAAWLAWSALPHEIAHRLDDGGAALEIGCGSGFGCPAAAERFPAITVSGHDRDPAAIARAPERAQALSTAAGFSRLRRLQGALFELRR
jgi:methylase of polypeptide subunit release factors